MGYCTTGFLQFDAPLPVGINCLVLTCPHLGTDFNSILSKKGIDYLCKQRSMANLAIVVIMFIIGAK